MESAAEFETETSMFAFPYMLMPSKKGMNQSLLLPLKFLTFDIEVQSGLMPRQPLTVIWCQIHNIDIYI